MKDFYKTIAEAEALDYNELNELDHIKIQQMVKKAKEKRELNKPVNRIINQIKDRVEKFINNN